MNLFVYHTPEEVPVGEVPDCAIAIDVLRATSTIAAAFEAGAEAIQVFSDIAELMQASEQWPIEKRIRAGERGGARVEGCDLGNSPLDHTPEHTEGRRLFMSTTNGTRCLQRIQQAPIVITSALTTRQATVQFLLQKQPQTVWLVGSGWEGTYSLEDTVCAGAIAHGIIVATGQTFATLAGNDALVAAVALYLHWQDQLLALMEQSTHGQRLLRLDNTVDLAYCAQLDILPIVPIQQEAGVLVPQVIQ
ncbi:MAG: 2-phosphosulfolactate phosphatase family protein [Leptolyngbyaceae cyanobacterium SM1_1_3]|nr:2-phosphosulfolactate phosphatase family protein [Leptolyngbyaceae cyanobacterium SM1_1_3]NJN01470.1 2-phosphosulfolactate phosphatase family protein [Leptolyngbyaceae cyanobacterium RM1_1_2]NJO10778.1 2-phosphosulfolactate phosphatase family protein [Leptolyngbyaceae cyanobacterium SL_1_1]